MILRWCLLTHNAHASFGDPARFAEWRLLCEPGDARIAYVSTALAATCPTPPPSSAFRGAFHEAVLASVGLCKAFGTEPAGALFWSRACGAPESQSVIALMAASHIARCWQFATLVTESMGVTSPTGTVLILVVSSIIHTAYLTLRSSLAPARRTVG